MLVLHPVVALLPLGTENLRQNQVHNLGQTQSSVFHIFLESALQCLGRFYEILLPLEVSPTSSSSFKGELGLHALLGKRKGLIE